MRVRPPFFVLAALAVATATGCGSSSDSEKDATTANTPAQTTAATTADGEPATSPVSVLGSSVDVKAGQVDVTLRLRQPSDADPPIAKTAQITLPNGIEWKGGDIPSCDAEVLKGGVDACPPGAVVGNGEAVGLTDQAETIGEITAVNGGEDDVYLATIVRHPAYVKTVVPAKISQSDDGLKLELTFPPGPADDRGRPGGAPVAAPHGQARAGAGGPGVPGRRLGLRRARGASTMGRRSSTRARRPAAADPSLPTLGHTDVPQSATLLGVMTRAANLPVSPVSAGRHGFPDVYVRYMQRTRIFDTACKVVTDRGLLEASFDHIQQPTGVTKGRVYDLYQTRDNLVVDAMAHALTFAQMRVCAAFDRAPTPAEGLDAAIWAVLDITASAPEWTRFALLEATAVGPDAWERRDRALAPVRDRLKRLMPSNRPKDAPQWGVEAVLAALRPQLVGEAILKPTPRLHRDLVNLVRTMCGMPPATALAKRPVRARNTTGWSVASRRRSSRSTAKARVDALRAELDVAIERRHGPALSQAVRCLVARDDEHDRRLAGMRKPVLKRCRTAGSSARRCAIRARSPTASTPAASVCWRSSERRPTPMKTPFAAPSASPPRPAGARCATSATCNCSSSSATTAGASPSMARPSSRATRPSPPESDMLMFAKPFPFV